MIKVDSKEEYQSLKAFVNRCSSNEDCEDCPLYQPCLSADIEPHKWDIKLELLKDDSNSN